MNTTYDTDPSTSTFAAAWASSPLGDPVSGPTELWETVEYAEPADPEAKPKSLAKHVALVAALACGIGLGAALGLAVFDFSDGAQPTVVVPGVSSPGGDPGANQPVPSHEAALAPSYVPAPNPIVSADQGASGSEPVASAPHSTPGPNVVPPSDMGAGSNVGSPPASAPGGPTVIIDIPFRRFRTQTRNRNQIPSRNHRKTWTT